MMVRMKTIMKLEDLKTIDQLSEFLSGTQAVAFSIILDKDDCYRWIQAALYKFRYRKLGKRDKGVLIHYLMKVSGYSRQQITRLITQYRKTGKCKRRQRTVAGLLANTRPRISAYWQPWMNVMTHPAAQRSRSCVNEPMRSLGRRSMPRLHQYL